MSRKHPPMWSNGCPTCGGVEVIVARGRGIARVMGPRQPFTPGQRRLWELIYDKWQPALRAAQAHHDEDGAYVEFDAIGFRLVRTGCFAEIAQRVGLEDQGRGSIRVYWPQRRTWKKTLAWCPDEWHEVHGHVPRKPRKPWEPYEAPDEPEPPRRLTSTMSAKERREAAAERRKAKARRHKEQQAKR